MTGKNWNSKKEIFEDIKSEETIIKAQYAIELKKKGRASKSTTTGRMEFTVGSETFQMQFKDKPNFEELKETLVNVLNGAEPVKCKIAY